MFYAGRGYLGVILGQRLQKKSHIHEIENDKGKICAKFLPIKILFDRGDGYELLEIFLHDKLDSFKWLCCRF